MDAEIILLGEGAEAGRSLFGGAAGHKLGSGELDLHIASVGLSGLYVNAG